MRFTNYYFLVLDIETSKEMYWDEELEKEMPRTVWLSYGVSKLVDIRGNTIKTCRFREWEELSEFFTKVTSRIKYKILCFVHNLGYEFDFLIKNVSKPSKFLCNSTHAVISTTLEGFNIEFRCTFQLSKLPLFKIGEQYGFPKLESDYRTIYPDQEVTQQEWDYCERDVDIMIPYILELANTYGLLSNIPYTSTGKVRRRMKQLSKEPDIPDWDLMPPEDCYDALCKVFRGAITMSNPRFTNVLINRTVRSFDEKSKYPSVMLTELYPYTIEKMEEFDQDALRDYKFYVARVKIKNIRSKYEWGVLSTSTCENFTLFNADIFNGKILNCGCIDLYITNVDLDIINLVYFYDNIEVTEFYPCINYAKLPVHFIELIKEYAENKTRIGNELKEIKEKFGEESIEYREKNREYMESKALLNGIYGMMVQKLISPEYEIDENYQWHEKEKPYKYIKGKHMGRNFLYGIFITAYSRYDLVKNIVHNCPENFVYCDTDSIKFIDIGKPFEDINSDIPEELQQYHYLKGFNRFEEEDPYSQFITYGAKKYAYVKNGHFGVTVAGLPKKTKIDGFNDFTLGTTYKDCKLAKRYIYHKRCVDIEAYTNTVINIQDLEQGTLYGNGGVALFETDYTLSMTSLDLEYIRERKSIWERKNIQQNILI